MWDILKSLVADAKGGRDFQIAVLALCSRIEAGDITDEFRQMLCDGRPVVLSKGPEPDLDAPMKP